MGDYYIIRMGDYVYLGLSALSFCSAYLLNNNILSLHSFLLKVRTLHSVTPHEMLSDLFSPSSNHVKRQFTLDPEDDTVMVADMVVSGRLQTDHP